jgi:hypothetical protein
VEDVEVRGDDRSDATTATTAASEPMMEGFVYRNLTGEQVTIFGDRVVIEGDQSDVTLQLATEFEGGVPFWVRHVDETVDCTGTRGLDQLYDDWHEDVVLGQLGELPVEVYATSSVYARYTLDRAISLGCDWAAVAGPAADCEPPWHGQPTTPGVIVLGNSITALSQDEIIAEMSDTFQVSVAAESGCTAGEVQDLADAYAGSDAWCVVVNVGSNDWPSGNVGGVFDRLQAIERNLQPPCFIVATLPQSTAIPELNSFAATFNFFLVFGTDWGIVDYDAIVRDWTATSDSLHPNADGQVLYARAIDEAVKGELWG